MLFPPPALILAGMLALASAFEDESEMDVLKARQAPGSPEYECHADCGYSIKDARQSGYCTNSTWLGLLEDCLACANEFDIWQYYGKGVGAAAGACGLDTDPSSASSAGGSKPTGGVASSTTAEVRVTDVSTTTSTISEAITTALGVSSTASDEASLITASPSSMVAQNTTVPVGSTPSAATAGGNRVAAPVAGGALGMLLFVRVFM